MGTWGAGILDDDVAEEIYHEYIDRYDSGEAPAAILAALKHAHPEAMDDEDDDGLIFWLAIGQAQSECSTLAPEVLARVTRIVHEGLDLPRWEEGENPKLLEQRREVLAAFLESLNRLATKPHAARGRRKRKPGPQQPVYRAGECLVVTLPDGDYGAVLVLAADDDPKPGGSNLVGAIRYKAKEEPTLAVFERCEWLLADYLKGEKKELVTWCLTQDHDAVAHLYRPIGTIALPARCAGMTCLSGSTWKNVISRIALQYRRESGDRS